LKGGQALLLAAGFGTRLQPLTAIVPKPLLPVNDTPLILYNLALLKHHGVHEVVINLHHLGRQISAFLGNGREIGMKIRYSREPKILGTGGGIRKAARFFDDDILVINSDVICDLSLPRLLAAHQHGGGLATLAVRTHPEAKRFGILTCTDSRLVSILTQPRGRTGRRRGHFTGVHILRTGALSHLAPDERSCITQDHYIPILQADLPLTAFLTTGFWSDCGTFTAVRKADQALRSGHIRLHYTQELQKLRQVLASQIAALLQKIYSNGPRRVVKRKG
jgi:NDP-sugar pyrophosphorylase family protein